MAWRMAARAGVFAVALGFAGSVLLVDHAAAAQPTKPKVKGKTKKEDTQAEKPAEQAASKSPKVGDVAPDWTAKDAEGKEHKLSEYKGKIVVMDFWATWCHWCIKGMPAVQKIHEKYADKGVVVLGMDCKESGAKADPVAFMKDKKYTYPIMVRADAAANTYGVGGIPDMYVIGPDGKVLMHEIGYHENAEAELSKLIDAHLSEIKKDGGAPNTTAKPDATKPAGRPTDATPSKPDSHKPESKPKAPVKP